MNLKVRRITNNDEVFLEDLDNLRAQINVHDNQLINILGNRMKVAEKIGLLKKKIMLLYFSLKDGMKF